MTNLLIKHPIAVGVIGGSLYRYFIQAHGDWSLFFNPLFPLFVHHQPWL